jgi:hypothetical protein
VFINPLSGIAIMFLLGFSWMPFFGLLMGRLLSETRWELYSLVALVIIFFATEYFCKATVSHAILRLICPKAITIVRDASEAANIPSSPYTIYLKHFGNRRWALKTLGVAGRNYFYSIEVISRAVATITMFVSTALIMNDSKAAIIGLVSSTIIGISITIADLSMFIGCGGYHMKNKAPRWIQTGSWGVWEFFTGFLSGLGLTILYICQDQSNLLPTADIVDFNPIALGKSSLLMYPYWPMYAIIVFGILFSMIQSLVNRRISFKRESKNTIGFFRNDIYVLAGIVIALHSVASILLLIFQQLKDKSIVEGNMWGYSRYMFIIYALTTFFLSYIYGFKKGNRLIGPSLDHWLTNAAITAFTVGAIFITTTTQHR